MRQSRQLTVETVVMLETAVTVERVMDETAVMVETV